MLGYNLSKYSIKVTLHICYRLFQSKQVKYPIRSESQNIEQQIGSILSAM